jgi:hypothetical protein
MSHTKSIGQYTVYSNGTVTSRHGWRGETDHIINPVKDKYGYLFVRLTVNGKRVKWKLSHLIAECFLPEKPFKSAIVRHLDDNKNNNAASNLAWGSAKDNALDRERNGKTSRGKNHVNHIKRGLAKAKANATLIAAAPCMLETLQDVLKALEARCMHDSITDQVREVIQKAIKV